MKNENTTTMPAAETTEQTMPAVNLEDMSMEELLEVLNDGQQTAEQANKAKNRLESLIKEDNKLQRDITVKTFAGEAARDIDNFFYCFITDPTAPTKKLSQDAETGKWSITDGKRKVSFTKVDDAYQQENHGNSIARSKRYLGMVGRLTHNLYRAKAGELGEDVDAKPLTVSFKCDEGTKIEEYDFSKCSVGGMTDQLNAIVKTIMPEGKAIEMRKADLRYIQTAFAKAADGEVKTINEQKVLQYIFEAMKVRMGNNAYKITSAAKCHQAKKSERTEKQEEVMSKVGDRPEAKEMTSKKQENVEG